MHKAIRHSDGVDSSNPGRWRGKRLYHHGGGVCWLFVLLWMDSWHHELIVYKLPWSESLSLNIEEILVRPCVRACVHLSPWDHSGSVISLSAMDGRDRPLLN
jgi:hypothetical protein